MNSLFGLLSVFLAFILTFVAGGVVYVDLAGPGGVGCGTDLANACNTILEGLNQAINGDTVLLADGTYSGVGNQNITLGAGAVQYVTVSGNVNSTDKVIISCDERVPAFSLNGFTMISGISLMSITNCQSLPSRSLQSGNGGGLYIRNFPSNFTISNVKFYNNSAMEAGGAIAGMAVLSLIIVDSEFFDNSALIRGGAVSVSLTTVDVRNCLFARNLANGTELATAPNDITYESGGRGGAFYGLSSTVGMHSCVFENNSAVRSGGAVYNEDMMRVSIDSTVFTRNSATGGDGECPADASCLVRGGAFYANNANNVTIKNSQFRLNSVSTPNINQVVQGGAVYMISSSTSVVISLEDAVLENCLFAGNLGVGRGENNGGGYGGALFVESQTVHLYGCEFHENWVGTNGLFSEFSSAGGAVWMGSSDRSSLTDCYLHDNYVVGGYGGALFTSDSTAVIVDSCFFESNVAVSSYTVTSLGGAVMIGHQSNVTIQHSNFTSNNALPRLDLDSTSPLTFSGEGGGLYVQSAVVQLYHNVFTENIVYTGQFDSGAGGGAVVLEDTYGSSIDSCEFTGNGAQGYSGYSAYAASGAGGGVMMKFSQAFIRDSKFRNNWVGAGGVQYSSGAAISIYYDYVTEAHGTGDMVYSRRTSAETETETESNSNSFPRRKTHHKSIHSNPYLSSIAQKKPSAYAHSSSTVEQSLSAASTTAGYAEPVWIYNCSFVLNAAYGLLCSNSPIPRSGQGGAISIMGANFPGVTLQSSEVRQNMALCDVDGVSTSVGGGLMLSLYSNFTGDSNVFDSNIAHNGVGDDVGMTSLDPLISTVAFMYSSSFKANLNSTDLVTYFTDMSQSICEDAITTRRRLEGEKEGQEVDPEVENIHFVFRTNRGRALRERFSRLPDIEILTKGVGASASAAPRDEQSVLRRLRVLEEERNAAARRLSAVDAETVQTIDSEADFIGLTEGEVAALRSGADRQELMQVAKEHPNQYTGGFTFHEKDPTLSHRRKLADAVAVSTLRQSNQLSPTILINGFMFMENPNILSQVLIFVGDVMELLLEEDDSHTGVQSASLVIEINAKDSSIGSRAVTVAGFQANITLLDAYKHDNVFEVANLLLFNSTLSFTNNVTVTNSSLIVGSVMTSFVESSSLVPSQVTNHTFNPTLKLEGDLYTGLYNISPDVDVTVVKLLRLHVFRPYMNIVGCTLEVYSLFVLSSVQEEQEEGGSVPKQLNLTEPFYVSMYRGGLIHITETGTMVVATGVYIDSDSDEAAIQNYGEISVGVQEKTNFFASLRVNSTVAQSTGGSIEVLFSMDTELSPSTPAALNMLSNKDMLGSINVNFTANTHMTYDTQPATTFLLAQYDDIVESAGPQVNYPLGLDFQNSYNSFGSDMQETIALSNMACGVVSTYYDGIQSSAQLCHYCIQNASCSYCPTANTCGGDGCGGQAAMQDTCCYNDCKNRGECKMTNNGDISSPDTTFYCDCNFWFTGADCGYLSAATIIFLAAGAFIIILAAVMLGYHFYYRKQKSQVLEELRQGLLFQEGGAGGKEKSVVSKHYLQALQQDLILKDVFVKYEDIKFEGKIGEGSFGVVFKGQFKGAQVAIKEMRAPLFQAFTENDIEEFRKEAYMMSRLRHPNIVLVMGIALKDQEPVMKRIKHPDEDEEEESEKEAEEKAKKKPLLKTVCIITEFLDQGSLADILYGPSRLAPEIWTYELVLTCALQAARGMLYLHSHQPPICHRDLKSSNLVVDDHWVVKVTDFGMSRIIPEKHREVIEKGIGKIVDETEEPDYAGRESIFTASDMSRHTGALQGAFKSTEDLSDRRSDSNSTTATGNIRGQKEENLHMTSNVGTTAWCAPELLTASSKTKYSVKIDVYSFGMVLWELIERKRPFEEYTSRFDIMDAIRSGKRPEIGPTCPPAYKSLIQRCWQAEPTRRPMFQYIVRYLKEELARVKRQRSASVTSASNAGWTGGGTAGFASSVNQPSTLLGYGAFSPQSLTELGTYAGRSNSVNSAASSSMASSLQNILPAWRTSSVNTAGVGASSSSGSQAGSLELGGSTVGMRASESDASRGVEDDRTFAAASVTNPMVIPRQSNLTANLNSSSSNHNTTPMKADRSKLAQMPPNDIASTPISTSSSMIEPGAYASSPVPQLSKPVTPLGGGAAAGKGNQWRDKYVMKFSGWKASAPDAGLPPSMVPQGSAAQGFRFPANSVVGNATSVAEEVRRNSTAVEDVHGVGSTPTPNDAVMDSARSGSLHNLDSVDYPQASGGGTAPDDHSPDRSPEQSPSPSSAARLSASLREELSNSNRSATRKASGSF